MLLSVFHRWSRGTALLAWRIRVFFLGAVLGLAGIFLNMSWLVTVALLVLLGAMLLRTLAARDPGAEKEHD